MKIDIFIFSSNSGFGSDWGLAAKPGVFWIED